MGDAVASGAEHIEEGEECVICDVDALAEPDDCGVEFPYCVYDVCQDGGIWTEVGWHEEAFDIDTCINHCACVEEATAMQWNEPTDDEPGFCGCLAFEHDTFNHAIHHGDTYDDEDGNGCVICNVEGVMGFSCHESVEEECMDTEEFEEWNDGVGCEEALEANDWDCDWEVWEGEPIGWFCAESCQSCEDAVGGTGEWTDACEDEAWPDEPIYWFCPVACGECESCEDSEDFLDAYGYGCDGWVGYDCTSYEGWTEEELLSIREACPSACGLCSSGDEPEVDLHGTVSVADDVEFVALEPISVTFTGATDEYDWIGIWLADHHPTTHNQANWAYHDSVHGNGSVDISVPAGGYYYVVMLCCDGTTEVSERVYFTVADAEVDPACVDAEDFTDSMNSDCSGWFGYDCTWDEETHTDWGYTEEDLLEIQANCQFSCGLCDDGTGALNSSGMALTVAYAAFAVMFAQFLW